MIEIPIYTEYAADFEQNIDLDNVSVNIRLTYNIRTASWTMRIHTENYILNGIKLLINNLLLDPYKAWFPELPGDFLVLPKGNLTSDFEYNDFGTIYALYYLSKGEVDNWRIENGLGS